MIDPDARQQAVARHQHHVRHEQVRRDVHVPPQLIDRRPQVRCLVRRVLQFDHRQRQAVQVDNQVRADPLPVGRGHRQLAHHEEVVVGRVVEIHQPRPPAAVLAGRGVAVFHLHAVGQQAVQPAVVLDQRRVRRTLHRAHDLFDDVVRECGVKPFNGGGKTLCEKNSIRPGSFARVVHFRAAQAGKTQRVERRRGGIFHRGFTDDELVKIHDFLPSMRLISRSKSEMYSASCRWR